MTDLAPTNHALMKLVKARVDADYPMTFIAQELGVDVDDLCHWILVDYREPRDHKPKSYQNKGADALGEPKRPGNSWSPAAQVRRQTAWQRQRGGASATRARVGAIRPVNKLSQYPIPSPCGGETLCP